MPSRALEKEEQVLSLHECQHRRMPATQANLGHDRGKAKNGGVKRRSLSMNHGSTSVMDGQVVTAGIFDCGCERPCAVCHNHR